MFTKLLCCHDAIKKLASFAKFYDYVHISMVDVALMEFDDVWMVYLLKYGELFFKQCDFFFDVLS